MTNFHTQLWFNIQGNQEDRVDFHKAEVIGNDNKWRRVQILESLLIHEHKPELNFAWTPLWIFNQ